MRPRLCAFAALGAVALVGVSAVSATRTRDNRPPALAQTVGPQAATLTLALTGAVSGAPPNPRSLVLRLSDLPPGFTVQSTHTHHSAADAARDGGTELAVLYHWGFLRSYLVRFAPRQQSATLNGPVAVISAAALFRTAGGAHAANVASRSATRRGGFATAAAGRTLGGDAWAYTYVDTLSQTRVYGIGWRRGTVQAFVAANGLDGILTRAAVLGLAEKQDRYLHRSR